VDNLGEVCAPLWIQVDNVPLPATSRRSIPTVPNPSRDDPQLHPHPQPASARRCARFPQRSPQPTRDDEIPSGSGSPHRRGAHVHGSPRRSGARRRAVGI